MDVKFDRGKELGNFKVRKYMHNCLVVLPMSAVLVLWTIRVEEGQREMNRLFRKRVISAVTREMPRTVGTAGCLGG